MSWLQNNCLELVEGYMAEEAGDTQSRLRNPQTRGQIKRTMKDVFSRRRILFGIDIEAWEHNTNVVTEIGVAIYNPHGQELALSPYIRSFHILIEENMNLRNGNYVSNHTNNFNGGESIVLSQDDAVEAVQYLINDYFTNQPLDCLFVGHNLLGDVNWLEKLGVELPENQSWIDTQLLYIKSHTRHRCSLKNALRDVNQPYAFLHNAGNDAYYTVLLALKLCDPQVRRQVSFDDMPFFPSWESKGQRLNKHLEENRSCHIYTTAEYFYSSDDECDYNSDD